MMSKSMCVGTEYPWGSGREHGNTCSSWCLSVSRGDNTSAVLFVVYLLATDFLQSTF